jgi:hypothetical protein
MRPDQARPSDPAIIERRRHVRTRALALGTIVGRVVRHVREGFAVRFVEVQCLDTVEAKVLLNDLSSVS